jgi:predicted ArsR family transcriptional regulator
MSKPTSADRILALLKRGGPKTARDLAGELGISAEGVRQQLLRLAGGGLVAAVTRACGVGRPSQRWQLTDGGQRRFPDAHAELTLQLIEGVRQVFGDEGLQRLVAARETGALHNYAGAMAAAATLPERVARLAELRTAEGYMACWEACAEGFLLVENHCPIGAAARHCGSLCESELALFQALLGPAVRVERSEHIATGSHRCSYLIRAAA